MCEKTDRVEWGGENMQAPLKLRQSCLCPLNTGITGVYYYTQLIFRVENGEELNMEDASGALGDHI